MPIREDDIKDHWLSAKEGPRVGVKFEEEIDFNNSLCETSKNTSMNETLHNVQSKSNQKIIKKNGNI